MGAPTRLLAEGMTGAGLLEPEGYLRWRRRYEGGDRQLTRGAPVKQEESLLAWCAAPAASGSSARLG